MDSNENIIVPSPQNNVFPPKDIAPIGRAYPNIINATCDCGVVRLLKGLVGGRFGELTLFNTLLFQRMLSQNSNEKLFNALSEIEQEDLKHIELLSNAITNFGGVPRFTNGQGSSWSARNVNYETNFNNFLRDNINFKERAIKEYERVITRIVNESLKELLNQIIEDENRHIVIFRKFLNA